MLKLHHLRIGRSIFTVWLLEELDAPYELEIYDRNEMGRAPPELKAAHPLGKSPVIDDDGFILAESGAIGLYLLEKFDPENKFGRSTNSAQSRAEWMQWLMYTEASAFAPMLIKQLAKSTTSGSRAAFRIVVQPSAIVAAIIKFSVAPTLGKLREISAPFRPSGHSANIYPSSNLISTPSMRKPSK